MVNGVTGGAFDAGLAELRNGEGDSPRQLRKVAREFESLLIAQMLKTVRESSERSWLGTGEDQAGTTMVEAAEQQLARALAAQGGLGLADLILSGLVNDQGESEADGTTTPPDLPISHS